MSRRKRKPKGKASKAWKEATVKSSTLSRRRIASFTVDEIRDRLANASYAEKDRERKERPFFYHIDACVSLRRVRIHMDMGMGLACVTCDRVGAMYHLEVTRGGQFHLDLYSGDDVMMTIDHVVAQSKGGTNAPHNKQMMCGPCNLDKGAKDMSELVGEPT